ncbi:MAG: vWA domain-containing protein [Planctomycetota bacterium]
MPLPMAISLQNYFLAPSVWYGLLALPLLFLMYFLRLRRQEKILSSTLLWGEAIKDLRVNAPFQRIKASLLLLLQTLILLLLGFALMRPFMSLESRNAKLVVILIDNSASMNTVDAEYNGNPMSRLDYAKAKAIDSIRYLSPTDLVMVAQFNQRPRTMQTWTNTRASIERAVRAIGPTDLRTDFLGAMSEVQEEINTKRAELMNTEDRQPNLLLYSDGAFGDQAGVNLDPALFNNFQYLQCGKPTTDNVGITDLNVRRSLVAGIKEPLQAFIRVENFAAGPRSFKVRVLLNDKPVAALYPVTLAGRPGPNTPPPPTNASADQPPNDTPWRWDESIGLPTDSSGALKVELVADEKSGLSDNLSADDSAVVDVPRVENTKILVVMRPDANLFLRRALESVQKSRSSKDGSRFLITYQTKDWFESTYGKNLPTNGAMVEITDFDMIIFYDYAPKFAVGCSAWYLGAIPALPGYKAGSPIEGTQIVDTNRSQYITRFINMIGVDLATATAYTYPPSAEVLIRGTQGALATADDNGRYRTVVVAFDPWDSDWLLNYTFPLFVNSTVDYLTGASERSGGQSERTGDPLTFPPVNKAETVDLIDPAGNKHPIELSTGGPVYFAETAQAGLYKYQDADKVWHYYGVNLASPTESDNAMHPSIARKSGPPILGQHTTRENREIWPYLVMIGLLILMIEWLVYHRQWSN